MSIKLGTFALEAGKHCLFWRGIVIVKSEMLATNGLVESQLLIATGNIDSACAVRTGLFNMIVEVWLRVTLQ
ncbi:hypothetical protein TorRG33x02_116560 [Trema orientale]|uniref:Uncharacterized protein n=1 Tax=Trema orientale TaxID=63057 RepID=A0A2P5F473_TREOI|nr:hypothetical protein TorRG33x02_116560 [Trema orientale]